MKTYIFENVLCVSRVIDQGIVEIKAHDLSDAWKRLNEGEWDQFEERETVKQTNSDYDYSKAFLREVDDDDKEAK